MERGGSSFPWISVTRLPGWHVVQELGHVLNDLSLEERLPTTFKPMSPPPYLKWWATRLSELAYRMFMKPGTVADWLEG